jgi:hypothetical protein
VLAGADVSQQPTKVKLSDGREIALTYYFPVTRAVVFGSTTKWRTYLDKHSSELYMYVEAYVRRAGAGPYRTPSDSGPLDLVELTQVEVTLCIGQKPAWRVPLAPLVVQHYDFERRLAALETGEKKRDLSLRFASVPPFAEPEYEVSVFLSKSPADVGLSDVVLLFGILEEACV